MPRFNQGVLALVLLVGFVFQWDWVIPAFAVILFTGAAFGAKWGLFLRIYRDLIAPRLAAPTEFEDPRPPRFAAAIGVAFLGVATAALGLGLEPVAWTLALIVAALAALAAITSICVGCEIYVHLQRRRAR
ncbi:MAG: DUF4395 domain-containing protein [Acidimicrobiia bacterium]|nr:DUF4395 domain-containing protein [Acidimicrobiia bacterium]